MVNRLVALALCFVCTTLPSFAEMQRFGSFVIYDDHPEHLALVGMIQQNAPLDLRRALRQFPDVKTLALASDGGDVTAGLLLAQEVFERGIDTVIPEGRGCYSACAFVYFAGSSRSVEGELGVHQMASLGAGSEYSIQVAVSDMLDTIAEFAVPASVIGEMLRTAPENMRVYSAAEAARVGLNRVNTASLPPPPPQPYSLPSNSVLPPSRSSAEPDPPVNTPPPAAILLAANGDRAAVPVYGQIWWTRTSDPSGGDMIVAELSVPQVHKSLEAKVTWRKNTDPTLPAEAIVEIKFDYAGPGVADEVQEVRGVLAKAEAMLVGRPLIGASAKVERGEFLFALSGNEVDATENSILLVERYLDLAVALESGRGAIVTLGKDDTALAMFRDVVESWVE